MSKQNRLQFTVQQYHQLHEIGVLNQGCPTELWRGIVYKTFPNDEAQSARASRFQQLVERQLGESVTPLYRHALVLSEKCQPKPEIMLVDSRALNESAGVFPNQVLLVITEDCYSIDEYDHQELLSQFATADIPELWLISDNFIEQRAAPIAGQYTYFKRVFRDDKIISLILSELKFQLSEFLGTD